MDELTGRDWIRYCVIAFIVSVFLILGGCWACPKYKVYEQRLEGEAELAKAESSKKVMIETARAKKESAQMFADAEVIRAQGVADANKIIGDSLKNNEAYLRYLWIDKLADSDGKGERIYIPTEAGIPILEARK